MTAGVAALAGLLVVAGLLLAIAGSRRRWGTGQLRRSEPLSVAWARLTRRPAGRAGRRRDQLIVVAAAGGVLVAASTGWLLALGLVPLLVLGVPYLLLLPKPRDADMLEALDRWVRALAATLGTGRSIADAIRVTRRTAPPLLAEALSVLVARLNGRWDTGEALRRFADDLGSADADAVIAALVLANHRGANGTATTLVALADSLQDQLKARRMIEAERSKPYVVVRQVTVITIGATLVLLVANPAFFSAYATPLGQFILAILSTAYFGALLVMRRRAQSRSRDRLLLRRTP